MSDTNNTLEAETHLSSMSSNCTDREREEKCTKMLCTGADAWKKGKDDLRKRKEKKGRDPEYEERLQRRTLCFADERG